MFCNPSLAPPGDVYRLLAGGIVPRPIAWVSTTSEDGVFNLAPFSFFTVASRNPAMLAISIGERDIQSENPAAKDTLTNIRDSGEFVVNIATEELMAAVEASSAAWPPGIDEFQVTGVTPASSRAVSAPRVAEAPVAYECVLAHELPLGTDVLVLGTVKNIEIADAVLDDRGRILLPKLRPLGRMSGPRFAKGLAEVTVAAPEAPSLTATQRMHAQEVKPR